MDTATKIRMGTAKTASKRVVQKTEEATGDLIGSKQLIKLLHQVNQKKKKRKIKEIRRNLHSTRKKKQKIIDDLRLFLA